MSDFPPFRLSDSYATRFPMKLWRFANACKSTAISWGETGRTLKIHKANFVREYLAVAKGIFKTRRFSSFIRQLNLYGFRKLVVSMSFPMTSADVHEMFEYHHPYFRRGHPELLACIQRRMGNTSSLTRAPYSYLEGINTCLENKLNLENIENAIKRENSVNASSVSDTKAVLSPVMSAVQHPSRELAAGTNSSCQGDGARANILTVPLNPYQQQQTPQNVISLLSNPGPSVFNIPQSVSQLTNNPLVLVPVKLDTDTNGQQQFMISSQSNYAMSSIQPVVSTSGMMPHSVPQSGMKLLNGVLRKTPIHHNSQRQCVERQAPGQQGVVSIVGPAVASHIALKHASVQPLPPPIQTVMQSCAGVVTSHGVVYPATTPIPNINSSPTFVDVAVTEARDNLSLMTSTRFPRTLHLSPNNLNIQANCSYTERANSVLQYISMSNLILPSSVQQTVKTCAMQELSTDSRIGCNGVTINPVSLAEAPPPDAALVYVYLNRDGTVTLEDTGNTPRASGDASSV